jgi:hypothetical protein
MAENKTPRQICREIAEDMANDATNFDGKVFNGRTVAEYFGNHGAAITALACLVESVLVEQGLANKRNSDLSIEEDT